MTSEWQKTKNGDVRPSMRATVSKKSRFSFGLSLRYFTFKSGHLPARNSARPSATPAAVAASMNAAEVQTSMYFLPMPRLGSKQPFDLLNPRHAPKSVDGQFRLALPKPNSADTQIQYTGNRLPPPDVLVVFDGVS